MTPRDATRGRQIEQYVEEPEFKEEHKSRALQQLSAVSGRLYDMAAKSEAAKEAKKGCVPALYPDFAHEITAAPRVPAAATPLVQTAVLDSDDEEYYRNLALPPNDAVDDGNDDDELF